MRPKKHLGQHFLRDEQIAEQIVDAMSAGTEGEILEVGFGTGILTRRILQNHPLRFYAYEVDEASVRYMKAAYPNHANQFLLKDILKADLTAHKPPLTIIGNLPYHISSQLFFKIYDHRDMISEAVCMIQKEVADRIAAGRGGKTYGILSVLLQAFFDVEYLFTVPPRVFVPPPKVQSAVIRLTRNDTPRLACDEVLFKQIVKEGFGKRRKTLRNALKALSLPSELTEKAIFQSRAEQLSVADFVSLTHTIAQACSPYRNLP